MANRRKKPRMRRKQARVTRDAAKREDEGHREGNMVVGLLSCYDF